MPTCFFCCLQSGKAASQDGESQRSEWCSQEHVQCWKKGETSGYDQAFIKGHRQVSFGHAKAWYDYFSSISLYLNYFLFACIKHYVYVIPGYIGEFEFVDDHRSGKIVVELNGRLNKCGVISPRFDVGVKEIEPWTARLLPSRQVEHVASMFSLL